MNSVEFLSRLDNESLKYLCDELKLDCSQLYAMYNGDARVRDSMIHILQASVPINVLEGLVSRITHTITRVEPDSIIPKDMLLQPYKHSPVSIDDMCFRSRSSSFYGRCESGHCSFSHHHTTDCLCSSGSCSDDEQAPADEHMSDEEDCIDERMSGIPFVVQSEVQDETHDGSGGQGSGRCKRSAIPSSSGFTTKRFVYNVGVGDGGSML